MGPRDQIWWKVLKTIEPYCWRFTYLFVCFILFYYICHAGNWMQRLTYARYSPPLSYLLSLWVKSGRFLLPLWSSQRPVNILLPVTGIATCSWFFCIDDKYCLPEFLRVFPFYISVHGITYLPLSIFFFPVFSHRRFYLSFVSFDFQVGLSPVRSMAKRTGRQKQHKNPVCSFLPSTSHHI